MRSVSGECMQGDSAGSNPRLCLERNRRMNFVHIPMLFLPRSSRW